VKQASKYEKGKRKPFSFDDDASAVQKAAFVSQSEFFINML
jgi:hypothetical protein